MLTLHLIFHGGSSFVYLVSQCQFKIKTTKYAVCIVWHKPFACICEVKSLRRIHMQMEEYDFMNVRMCAIHYNDVMYVESNIDLLPIQLSWNEPHTTAKVGKIAVDFYDDEGATSIKKVCVCVCVERGRVCIERDGGGRGQCGYLGCVWRGRVEGHWDV